MGCEPFIPNPSPELFDLIEYRFLLVRLHVDYLAQLPTIRHIRRALQNMPRFLSNIYEKATERIENQGEYLHQLARKVIFWLTHAKRVLSMTELQHAVAVEAGNLELDEDSIPDKEILVSICAGLVTHDTESDVLRMAHYTVQEYFEGEGKSWVQDAETDIATTCITSLSFRKFEGGICKTSHELDQRLMSNPLYRYAANYWGHHARASSTNIQPILDFLHSNTKVSAASQALDAYSRNTWYFREHVDRSVCEMRGIHHAAYFGLENIATQLLEGGQDVNAKGLRGRTPIFWAIEEGQQSMVKHLLNFGAEVNVDASDVQGLTPLLEAVTRKNEGIAKLLLENGAEVDATDELGQTCLFHALRTENESIAAFLLGSGADIYATDIFGKTPLGSACIAGKKNAAKFLLAHGADIEAADCNGHTPLSQATRWGYEEVVRLLLEHGADIEATNCYGQTSLSLASEYGNEDVIRLLLEHGAAIEAADRYGRTSLYLACHEGREDAVRLLLEHGAITEAADENGWTSLIRASMHGRENVVRLLLQQNAEIEATDKGGLTPLIRASMIGREAIVRLLLEHGAEVNAADKDGRTALFCANSNGYKNVVKLLLERGADAQDLHDTC